jgi:hypothetical protein
LNKLDVKTEKREKNYASRTVDFEEWIANCWFGDYWVEKQTIILSNY